MAKNTQKPTLYEIYKDVCFDIGSPASSTVESVRLKASDFLNKMNGLRRLLSAESQDIFRLALLFPEQNWIRMVARPYSLNGGIIRIDLQGQTRQLLKSGDCRQWQYEDVCSGVGTDPNYVGYGAGLGSNDAPDSFPMIAFPSESDIDGVYYPPTLSGDRELTEPLTTGLFDIRTTGYGGNDITSTDYPTVSNPNSYLRDCFLIYALTALQYTTGTDYSLPYNPDEYLNSTWTEILELTAGVGVVSVDFWRSAFTVDGHTYTITMLDPDYNTTTNDPFHFRITTTVGVDAHIFNYQIYPDDTPWQTVSNPGKCDRWGPVFGSIKHQGRRAHYIAFNQRFVNLPDDLEEIRWFYEIPQDFFRQRLDDDDPTADVTVEEITTAINQTLNQTSGAVQLFPIGESRFTWQKYLETNGMIGSANGGQSNAGYYFKMGSGRIMILPRPQSPRDAVYALLYVALDDKYELNMPYADLQTTYIDLHGASQDLFTDYILFRYYKSTQGADARATIEAKEAFQTQLYEAKVKMNHRGSQQGDGPMIGRELPFGAMLGNKPYFDALGSPEDWFPDVVQDSGNY